MAKVTVLKDAIQLCGEAGITPFLWGHRGLGKSSIVRQVCETNGWGFVDCRMSQIEAPDLRGLPAQGEDGQTHYLPPADMPIGDKTFDTIYQEIGDYPERGKFKNEGEHLEAVRQYRLGLERNQNRFQRGILFLDELNRAQDDVAQAAFQLVLDHRIGQYILPPGWMIVAAGNYMEGYQVNGFTDAAFLDRFCHLQFSHGESTVNDWVDYMAGQHGSNAAEVVEFATQDINFLDGNLDKSDLGFSVTPSRRSWESVIKVMEYKTKYSEEACTEVLSGLLGREVALSFVRYSCPIKPRDLLSAGVKRYAKQIAKLNRNQIAGLCWGLYSYCKNKINEPETATVCVDFAESMVKNRTDNDLAAAFCRQLVGSDANDNHTAMISNPALARITAKYSKKSGKNMGGFMEELLKRPELQKLLSNVAWGR